MLFKGAQAFLASALLSQAGAAVLKPISESEATSLFTVGQKRAPVPSDNNIQLKPIHDPADLIVGHPRRRAVEGNEVWNPTSQHSFFWAQPIENDVYLANFTLDAPDDNEKIVPIENFADRLKSIKCSADTIVIEFNSNDCYDYASKVWNWVNDDQNNTMTLVTKAGQCDPDEDRDPFRISGVKFEKDGLKATLAAKRLSWEEAAHDFSFTTSNHANAVKPSARRRWDLFNDFKDDVKDKFEDVKDKTEETFNNVKDEVKDKVDDLSTIEKKESSAMNINFKYDQNLFDYGKEKYGMSLKAGAQAKTGGQLLVDLDIKVVKFEPKTLKMKLRPKGLNAQLMLALTASGELGKTPIKYNLPGVKIPVASISIPKVIQLGPVVEGSIFLGTSKLKGVATASVGGKAKFSDNAVLEIDALNKNGNTAKGWTPEFEKIAPQFSASLEGGVRAGISLSIGFEASILNKFGLEAKVNADAPYFEATMKAQKNTVGVCKTKKTLGIEFGAEAGIDISLDAGLLDKAPIFSAGIWQPTPIKLPWNQCMAFGPEDADTKGTILTAKGGDKTKTSTGKADATKTGKPDTTKTNVSKTNKPEATGTDKPKPTASGNASKTKTNASDNASKTKSSASGNASKTTGSANASKTTGAASGSASQSKAATSGAASQSKGTASASASQSKATPSGSASSQSKNTASGTGSKSPVTTGGSTTQTKPSASGSAATSVSASQSKYPTNSVSVSKSKSSSASVSGATSGVPSSKPAGVSSGVSSVTKSSVTASITSSAGESLYLPTTQGISYNNTVSTISTSSASVYVPTTMVTAVLPSYY